MTRPAAGLYRVSFRFAATPNNTKATAIAGVPTVDCLPRASLSFGAPSLSSEPDI